MEQLQHSGGEGIKVNIPESIKSAAIIFNGVTYTGVNHATAIRELEKVQPDWFAMRLGPVQEGFLTSDGRFVESHEAGDIAEKAFQLTHLDSETKKDAKSNLDSYHLRH